MNIEEFRNYCLSFKGVTEEFPFDNKTLVFKVGGKMFTATKVDTFESFNVKCDPEKAIELREQYDCVIPGYHMNKKHWNTIITDNSLPNELLKEWIKDSYDLIFSSLSKKVQRQIETLNK